MRPTLVSGDVRARADAKAPAADKALNPAAVLMKSRLLVGIIPPCNVQLPVRYHGNAEGSEVKRERGGLKSGRVATGKYRCRFAHTERKKILYRITI